MRHEQLKDRESFDLLDAAEIWPRAGAPAGPLAEVEAAFRPTPAAPDVPAAVGRMIVGAYVALVAVFLLTMARGPEATFAIVVSALYVAIFLAVPRLFLAVEPESSRRPSLSEFLARGLDTWTGPIGGGAALVQMFVVPVLVCLGLLVIGIAARIIL